MNGRFPVKTGLPCPSGSGNRLPPGRRGDGMGTAGPRGSIPYPHSMHFPSDYPHQTWPALPCGDPTDEQLMERIQHHDERALAMLHQRHRPHFRSVIGRRISNAHDLDDIEQQCLLQIWRLAGSYSAAKGQALSWLTTLARRRTIDHIRRKSAYMRVQDEFRDATTPLAEPVRGADEEAAQSDTAGVVTQMIEELPHAQQQAVELAYFRGMSQRQIAAHTGVPLGTIKTRLDLALRKLRTSVRAVGELHEALEPTHA